MSPSEIQHTALGVPRRGDDVFVAELDDVAADETFHRPVGGGIEFGERSADAVVREFREELGVEVAVTNSLGVVENRYTYEGRRGHELVLVHETTVPPALESGPVSGADDGGTTYLADWQPISRFAEDESPLYPVGLLSLLRGDSTHVAPAP